MTSVHDYLTNRKDRASICELLSNLLPESLYIDLEESLPKFSKIGGRTAESMHFKHEPSSTQTDLEVNFVSDEDIDVVHIRFDNGDISVRDGKCDDRLLSDICETLYSICSVAMSSQWSKDLPRCGVMESFLDPRVLSFTFGYATPELFLTYVEKNPQFRDGSIDRDELVTLFRNEGVRFQESLIGGMSWHRIDAEPYKDIYGDVEEIYSFEIDSVDSGYDDCIYYGSRPPFYLMKKSDGHFCILTTHENDYRDIFLETFCKFLTVLEK